MASYSKIEKEALQKATERSAGYANKATGLSDEVKAEIQKNIDKAADQMQAQNQQATTQTNSAYDSLINAANIDRLIREREIEQAIGNQPLNSSQQLALNLASGNAQYNANTQRDAAVKALANILSGYSSQSRANQLTSTGAFDNTLSGSVASNRSANDQNALSNAASMYTSATEAETVAADAAAKAQLKAFQYAYSANKTAQDKYYSNLNKLLTGAHPQSYEDAVSILSGEEPKSEIQAREESEQAAQAQARQEAINGPEKPNVFDRFLADYGNNASRSKVENWEEWNARQMKPNLSSVQESKTGAWVDPDKSVRQFAETVRQSVNAGDYDQDFAVKRIIANYIDPDNNPNVQSYNYQGKTIYAPGDDFKNAQIGFAIDMAGLRPYVDKNKSKYYNSNVGNGSWILQ